ncbi:MAG TPA: putative sugar nucleotidyl transferase [Gemmatimonadales bacterium]|nr:putative sugar nucleotidyl transferase [Gemmatimonadales bacterium]
MPPLYLLEPDAPGAAWMPFTGVRPLCELRAGVWRIRERWEGVLGHETTAILGAHVAGFHEMDEPPVEPRAPVAGPALVCRSDFAPSGEAPELPDGTRRLIHDGVTVAWIVPDGATWAGPNDDGPASEIAGLLLGGAADLITALEHLLEVDVGTIAADHHTELPEGSLVLGEPAEVAVLGAFVEPGVTFDTRQGAIVIEEGAEVRSGTRLEGPCFIGPRARILGGFIRQSVIGAWCVVRGEVSTSLFLGFANKAHDGFVGHSVLGHWVNLGAMTTTSNLKNTYGEVRLELPTGKVGTGRQYLGTLLGDHAKTAIGTMLATGTVVGAGANVFGAGRPPKFVPPMSWGETGGTLMTKEGFLAIAERVLPRRQVEVTPERRAALERLWERATGA